MDEFTILVRAVTAQVAVTARRHRRPALAAAAALTVAASAVLAARHYLADEQIPTPPTVTREDPTHDVTDRPEL